jgi:pathogenesis-related protein 1
MYFKAKRGHRFVGFAVAHVACLFAGIALLGCSAANDGTSRSSPQAIQTLQTAGIGQGTGIGVGVGFGTAGVMALIPGAGAPAAGRGGGAGSAGFLAAGGAAAAGVSGGRSAAAGSGGSIAIAGSAAGAVAGASGSSAAMGETGRMAGMTAAHNAIRAMVQTTPALAPMVWSPTLAAYAQEWTDNLAKTSCAQPRHRSSQELQANGYGENLAAAGGSRPPMTTAQFALDGWAGEVACWTYGSISAPGFSGGTEQCDLACYQKMNSDGCGHYTQVVWRNSTQLGCGVSSCQSGGVSYDIWICNYGPPGNVLGQKPY